MSFFQPAELPLSSLLPNPGNARRHSPKQIRQIAESITRFGFSNPILVDENNEIIAGHGRWMAAKKLGLDAVPVVRAVGLDDVHKRALRIADNKLAENASWDLEALGKEMNALLELDFDLGFTGFDDAELDRLLTATTVTGSDSEEPLPDLPRTPFTRTGDIWLCGEHRVTCGDARRAGTYEALLGDACPDLIFTDPPYNVAIAGNVSGLGKKTHADFQMASGEMSPEEFMGFLTETLRHARDASRDGSLHYICMDWRGIERLLTVGRELFTSQLNLCVWAKPNGGMGSFYRSQHELVAVFKHGTVPHINNVQLGRFGRNRSNLWQYPGGASFSATRKSDLADHPTVKPLALVSDAIRDATKPGDLVLDMFGGAGTTLLAANATKRKAALIEIDPAYVDVILTRFQKHTGKEPLLLPDLTPLSLVKSERHQTQELSHV